MEQSDISALGLTFYPDSRPGIVRQRRGRGFSYQAPDGTTIDCRGKRRELAAIAVPPAYSDVWISPRANGHLRASGRDARTRKQYIYHQKLAEARSAAKYDQLRDLAEGLPRLRGWIARGLRADPGSEDHALALILALIDRYSLRVGDPAYTEENGSHAATTLLGRHLRHGEEGPVLDYPAKGGVQVRKPLRGARLLAALDAVKAGDDEVLVAWTDGSGARRAVRAEVVNARLSELCRTDVTAKALRTWNGTHAAFVAARQGAATVTALAEAAAARLHNTPAVARSSYIHPDVIALTDSGDGAKAGFRKAPRGLRLGERELAELLDC